MTQSLLTATMSYPYTAGDLPKSIELEGDEAPVFLTRQHWYVFRDSFLVAFFLPFLMLSATFFLDYSSLPVWFKDNLGQFLLWGALISFAVGSLLLVWRFYLWSRTVYVITNKRLILLIRKGLFSSEERECSLSMIQDVKTIVDGLQPTLYGFGEVVVQVSSQDARLIMEKVGKPHKAQHILMREAHLRT